MRLIPIWILAATIGTLVACGGSAETPKADDPPTEEAAEDAKADEGEADKAGDDAEQGGEADEGAADGGQICCAIERDGKKMRRRTTSEECKNKGGEEMPLDKCPQRSKAPAGKRSKH